MNYTQFLSSSNTVLPLYLITGDSFLAEDVVKKIKIKLRIVDDTSSVSVFDAENFQTRAVINACEQMSFFDDKRLVIVKNVTSQISEADKKLFALYAKNPNPNCVLLVVDNSEKSVFDFLEAEKISCSGLYDSDIEKIVKQFAYAYDTTIDSAAIKLLSQYTQKNLQFMKNEIEKLCAYKQQEKVITVQDVELMVAKQDEIVVYELTTALSQKQADKSIWLLKKLMGTPDQNIKLFGLIVGNFRRMFFASISKQSDAEIAKAFGVKEFAITKAKQQAKNFSPKKLKYICELLSDVDYYSKSGIMTLENGLYYVCYKILYQQ